MNRVRKYNYSIEIKDKPRTFHINMLQQYFTLLTEDSIVSATEIIKSMVLTETDSEQVTIPLPSGQTESYHDVKYAQNLTPEQLKQLQELIKEYQDICTDTPETTWIEEHKIDLTTEDCVKQIPISCAICHEGSIQERNKIYVRTRHNRAY